MLGWFKHRKTGKRVLLNVKSISCQGYGQCFNAVEIKTGKLVETGYFGEYFPYGKPVKQPFPN